MFAMSMMSNIGAVLKEFKAETARIKKAPVDAINQVAFEIRREWVSKMPSVFDRPTASTQRSPRYEKATIQNPVARVFILDTPAGGRTSANRYLGPQVFGGARPMKPSERVLGHYYVPGPGAQLDKNGNLNFNTLRAVLSAVGGRGPAFPGKRKGGARRNRGKRYFILHEQLGKLPAGVYERASSGIKLVLIFFPSEPQYKAKRFDAYGIANYLAQGRFPAVLRAKLDGRSV